MLYWKWWCMTVVLVLRRLRQEVQYQPWLHGKNLSQKSNQIKSKPQNNSSPNPKNKYHVVYWPFQVSLVSVCHHLIHITTHAGCPSHSVAISHPISLSKLIFHALHDPATGKEKWIHTIASDQWLRKGLLPQVNSLWGWGWGGEVLRQNCKGRQKDCPVPWTVKIRGKS